MIEQIQNTLLGWWQTINSPPTWVQMALVATALLSAFFISRKLTNKITSTVSRQSIRGARKVALRTLQRLLFPLLSLTLLLPVIVVLKTYKYPVYMLEIATPLLVSMAVIRLMVYVLRKSFTPSAAMKAWEHTISTLIWMVVALHLLDLLAPLMKTLDQLALTLGTTRISLLDVINIIIISALLFTLSIWLAKVIERSLRKSPHLTPGLKVGITKFMRFFLITVAILLTLHAAGIDLTALTVFGGALGVGLGFGLQRIASNFISGFILILDRSIKPGDVITIGNKFGWVQELHSRYIVVRNREGVDTLIPNENLITSEVINWSYGDPNVRISLPVQISYDDDPEQALKILLEAANQCPRVLKEPEASARLMAFGDNGINLELRVWINDPYNGIGSVRSEINLSIWRAFKQAGITIPYPQRDVYIKSSV